MSEKHYPYIGGSFDRIVFDGDGSVWVPEPENAKLRRMVRVYRACHDHINACRGCEELPECDALRRLRELGREIGIEVDA